MKRTKPHADYKQEFSAVRWPKALHQELKIAAARHTPPITMGEYLRECMRHYENRGRSNTAIPFTAIDAKRAHARIKALGRQILATRDPRRIQAFLAVLDLAVADPPEESKK